MATTGIIQRRDLKINLIADPPLIGEIVYALDTEEFGTLKSGILIWRSFEKSVNSVNGKVGDVILDKNDIGLNNVDNTADIDKPVSTATQTLIDSLPQADWNETDTNNHGYIENKPTNITTQGNTFNNANELVQLDASGNLPILDGSQLTGIIPTQTGEQGKILVTDGTNLFWDSIKGGTF